MTVTDTERNTLGDYAATLEHIRLIADKLHAVQVRLGVAKSEAEQQLLHRVAGDYAAGRLTDRELCTMYDAYRAASGAGFTAAWNLILPISAVRMKGMKDRFAREDRCAAASWSGEFPFEGGEATPPGDFSVVYVLFDDVNVPCYVGSTQDFRSRLRAHARGGKCFSRWTAYPCANREAAYVLEEKLLGEHRLYLNKKVCR